MSRLGKTVLRPSSTKYSNPTRVINKKGTQKSSFFYCLNLYVKQVIQLKFAHKSQQVALNHRHLHVH